MLYLDIDIWADLDAFAKIIDELHEAGEFPHVAQLVQHGRDGRCRYILDLDLFNVSLAGWHVG